MVKKRSLHWTTTAVPSNFVSEIWAQQSTILASVCIINCQNKIRWLKIVKFKIKYPSSYLQFISLTHPLDLFIQAQPRTWWGNSLNSSLKLLNLGHVNFNISIDYAIANQFMKGFLGFASWQALSSLIYHLSAMIIISIKSCCQRQRYRGIWFRERDTREGFGRLEHSRGVRL